MKRRIAVLAVLLGLLYLPVHTQSASSKQTPATEAAAQYVENDYEDVSSVESTDADADVVSMPITYTMTTGGIASSGRVMLSAVDKAAEASFLNQVEAQESLIEMPTVYHLDQNFPNPFNPVTEIHYSLPSSSHVTLKVYNMLGQLVSTLIDGEQESGYQSVQWAASDLSSGVYFYQITAGTFSNVKRMMLVK